MPPDTPVRIRVAPRHIQAGRHRYEGHAIELCPLGSLVLLLVLVSCASDDRCTLEGAPCPEDEYCAGTGCEDDGVCAPLAAFCEEVSVCGCDGETYGNACVAESAGTRVASVGQCDDDSLPDLIGIYHLPNKVDAVNLELSEDETFRWSIQGCDFFGGSQGRWREEPGKVVLLPEAGETTFGWMDDVSFGLRREMVELAPGEVEGEIVATDATGGDAENQTWIRGGICPICDTPFGPSGLEPCDAVLTDPDRHLRRSNE